MKIGIVAGPYVAVPPKKYGGTERIIEHLVKGLLEEGHEVLLVAPGDSKVDCELLASTPAAIGFPRRKSDKAEYEIVHQKALQNTHDLIISMAKRVDIIHSHGFDMIRYPNIPNITTLHGPITFEQIPYYIKRKNLTYNCISSNQSKVLPSMRCAGVVYNGLNPDEFPFVQTPEDYLVFLGRFDREKSPHKAIQLALALGIKIKLAGKIDFQGEGYFEEFIEPYFDNPLVEYLGEVGFTEKVELLSHALCNLHPTGFREPFGLTILEAAYCGTPTIAISRGSMPELIADGLTGLLVEEFEEGFELFEKVKDMDRTLISSRARSMFNYKNMSRAYVDMYKKVIERHTHHIPERSKKKWSIEQKAPFNKTLLPNLSSISLVPKTPHIS